MAYLTKFGINNFRVFKDMTDFEFAPITILTGTNSSGKSSLIKALLLLKDNVAESLRKFSTDKKRDFSLPKIDRLDFTGKDHKLPGFENCLNSKIKTPVIVFKFPLDLGLGEECYLELHYKKSMRETSTSGHLSSVKVLTLQKNVLIFDFNRDDQNDWCFYANYSFIQNKTDLLAQKQKESEKNEEAENHIESLKRERLKELDSKKHKGIFLSVDELNELLELNKWRDEWQNKIENRAYNSLFSSEQIIFHKTKDPFTSALGLDLSSYNSNTPFYFFLFNSSLQDKTAFLKKISDADLEYFRKNTNEIDSRLDRNYVYYFIKEHIDKFTNALLKYLAEKEFENITSLNDLNRSLRTGEMFFYQFFNKNTFDLEKWDRNSIEATFSSNPNNLKPQLWHYIKELTFLNVITLFNNDEKANAFFNLIKTKIPENKKTRVEWASIRVFSLSMLFQNSYYRENPDFQTVFNFIDSKELKSHKESKEPKKYFFEDIVFNKFKEAVSKTLLPFTKLNFSEAVRANTQRAYAYNSQGTGINELLVEFESLEMTNDSYEVIFINKWLSKFDIGNKLTVKQNTEGLGTQVYIDGRSLADMGYGVTQFLPLLLKICVVARNNMGIYLHWDITDGYGSSIIFIEEPETNLHPRLQSLLADMFVDAAKKFHIQFIIETHSEYLIRKLQYLTANKEHEYNIKPEDTAIYYFNDPKTLKKGDEQVRRICIREDGILDGNFGSGFFDEASNLIKEIFKLSGTN